MVKTKLLIGFENLMVKTKLLVGFENLKNSDWICKHFGFIHNTPRHNLYLYFFNFHTLYVLNLFF